MPRIGMSTRVLALTAAILVVVSAFVLFGAVFRFRGAAEGMMAERAAAFTAVADATKEHVAKLHELDTFRRETLAEEVRASLASGNGYTNTRMLGTVPIVAGWAAAMVAAKREGLDFRIVALDARNADNDPRRDQVAGGFRASMLADLSAQFAAGGETTLTRIDHEHNNLHFMRGIKLNGTCMQCHGDPATSPTGNGLDLTGFRMENWQEGAMHGAYEVVMPLAARDAQTAGFIKDALVFGLPACLIGLLVLWLALDRALRRPLRLLATRLREVAEGDGDLTRRMALDRQDEVGDAAAGFDRFASRVHDTVVDIVRIGGEVENASTAMSRESMRLAEGASKNAATIEEISATLVEIGTLAEGTATSCREACDGATRTREAVEQGNAQVGRLEQAMAAIQESSQAVNRIVNVIQDVSFQTNLLALNAAVEAARAGEAGRGFAVVAEEVRNLAQRSATAANETSQLIEQARQRAENGVQIAAQVKDVLVAIDGESQRFRERLSAATINADQQSGNVAQVSRGVGELSQTTQDNAASAEELAVTAKQSSDRIGELQRTVGTFKVAATRVARP
jgi:methyl-accepting chemotaxis protein